MLDLKSERPEWRWQVHANAILHGEQDQTGKRRAKEELRRIRKTNSRQRSKIINSAAGIELFMGLINIPSGLEDRLA